MYHVQVNHHHFVTILKLSCSWIPNNHGIKQHKQKYGTRNFRGDGNTGNLLDRRYNMKTLGIIVFNLWGSDLIPIFKNPGETGTHGLTKNLYFYGDYNI
jgi:hypothetical protein